MSYKLIANFPMVVDENLDALISLEALRNGKLLLGLESIKQTVRSQLYCYEGWMETGGFSVTLIFTLHPNIPQGGDDAELHMHHFYTVKLENSEASTVSFFL